MPLTPKAFEILLFLIEHRGTIVSKDDLMRYVWGETSVEEGNISKNISQLRKALADGGGKHGQGKTAGENDNYIVTHSKLGYRFVHPVEEITITPPKVIRQTTLDTSAAVPSRQMNPTASAVVEVEVANDFLSNPVLSNPESFPAPKPSNSRVRVYLGGLAAVGLLSLAALFFWFRLRKDSSNFDLSKLETKAVASWKTGLGADLLSVQTSPDGNFIVYPRSETGPADIYVRQVIGDESKVVTQDEWPDYSPVWSPDSQKIAYLSARENCQEVWINSMFGGKGEMIHSLSNDHADLLRWSKDGTTIYYVTLGDVFALDLKSRQSVRLTNFDGTQPNKYSFSLSPDEKSIAYVEMVNKSARIFKATLSGSDPKQLTNDGEQNLNPTWFADGKQILYSSKRGNSYHLCVAYLDGRPPVQLSTGHESTTPFYVSPDERKIFYSVFREEADIYRLDTKTGGETRITSDALLEILPNISPDGKKLAFQHAPNQAQLLSGSILTQSSDAKSTGMKELADGFDARWSPRTDRLAFLRDIGGVSNLWTIRSDGADQRQLTQKLLGVSGFSTTPYDWKQPYNYSWSPKGDLLAFSAIPLKESKIWNIWTVSADGGAETMISTNNDPAMKLISPIWSPDGGRLVYLAQPADTGRVPRSVVLHERGTDGSREQTLFQTDLRIRMMGWTADRAGFLVGLIAPEERGVFVNMELKRLAPGQQDARLVAQLPAAYFNSVRLSPDGKSVAFISRQNDYDNIWEVSLDDRRPKQLTNNKDPQLRYGGLAWSPDRKSIFFSKQSATTMIWAMENFH